MRLFLQKQILIRYTQQLCFLMEILSHLKLIQSTVEMVYVVPPIRLPPGRLGEWVDYQFVNAVSDCYGNHYTLKMRLNNFSFAVQNGKRNVDTPVLAGFQYNRFWFFAQEWRNNCSKGTVQHDTYDKGRDKCRRQPDTEYVGQCHVPVSTDQPRVVLRYG